MVGVAGFEPATTRTPSVCATRLRYTPTAKKRSEDGDYNRPCGEATAEHERSAGPLQSIPSADSHAVLFGSIESPLRVLVADSFPTSMNCPRIFLRSITAMH